MFPSPGVKVTPTDWSTAARTRTGGPVDTPFRVRPWLAPLVTMLAAWLVAFLVVTTLLTLFGDELGSLPLALRALVMSGVLVALMANVVMPVVSGAVARWVGGSARTQESPPRGTPKANTGIEPSPASKARSACPSRRVRGGVDAHRPVRTAAGPHWIGSTK
jgi:hypothetical protein